MSSKRSILNRVLYLNLTMAVVLTLVFLCTSGLYARQLTRERYNLASTTLTKVNTDFQLEMNRLDSLLTLCLQDSSLVFSISDRLDTSFFLDNAEDAASRLSLIRQSLPYAKLVYLYTHNSDKVVRDNGSLYKGEEPPASLPFSHGAPDFPGSAPSRDSSVSRCALPGFSAAPQRFRKDPDFLPVFSCDCLKEPNGSDEDVPSGCLPRDTKARASAGFRIDRSY